MHIAHRHYDRESAVGVLEQAHLVGVALAVAVGHIHHAIESTASTWDRPDCLAVVRHAACIHIEAIKHLRWRFVDPEHNLHNATGIKTTHHKGHSELAANDSDVPQFVPVTTKVLIDALDLCLFGEMAIAAKGQGKS